ncbi:hypothetical protein [Bifidobacterium moukalabense]|uniref:hypothetical protein n=1 Tax=Bifidobacterium moukalabense TaxID=1333651 RepID=UPI001F3148E7|nr:hypothetical protein [Bifidobacterium moukalabense]
MAKSLHARLVAYRPFGARIGILAMPVSFSASMLHDDDGAISIEYSLLSGDAQAFDRKLTDGLEIAVEVSDGTGYVEPDNARFVITGRSGKTDDRTRTVTYSGQSIGWLLSKAENNDSSHLLADGDNKGKRPFYSSNPGTILKTLLDENRQRGGIATGLTLGFDTAKDSSGTAWAKKYTLYYSLGTDLQTILSSLVNGGGCDWRTSGRVLKLWNADSTSLSRDLSKSIVLQLARDISEAPYEESIADLASTILVEGDNDLLFRMDNPAAPTPWGKWESYSSQGGVSDKDTAQAFMQSTLDDAARVRGQYTRDLIVNDVDSLPLVDYHAGDWITAPTVNHGEKVRVQEIDLSMRQNEGLSASIALNDIKYDASVRQAKKIKGITGGAALAGSESGTTASSDHDHRVPKAPQGLIVGTDAYLDATGYARGLATVKWAAVTQATDSTAIEISSYRVEWRRHVDGAPWRYGGVTDGLQLGIGNLDCGTVIEVRVRAMPTYSDQPGEWSEIVVATVESDVTPCSVPSKPVLSSKLGVVTVHWDGRTSDGGAMESDFDHLVVGSGSGPQDITQFDASVVGMTDLLDSSHEPGDVVYYALASVDHAGNQSEWSETASIEVASAVTAEQVERIQKDLAANTETLKDNSAKLEQAQKDIAANRTAQAETAKQLDSAKSDITANQTAIDAANQTLQGETAKLAQARKDIVQAQSDITSITGDVERAKADILANAEQAEQAQKTADGKNLIYRGPNEPAHDGLKPGDMWWRTQAYWTRWEGDANASPSDLADFYTYWQGEPNNSPSVLVPLADCVIEVLTWNGTTFEPFDLVANNILAAGSVVAKHLAADSVTAEKVKANAITVDKLAANSVTTEKLVADAVTAAKLAADSVTARNITALAVTTDKLAANSVTTAKLKVTEDMTVALLNAHRIQADDIVSGAVTTDKLAANSVNADKLAVNSVDADKLVSGAVTADKLAANSVTAVKLASRQITADKIAYGTITGSEIKSRSIRAEQLYVTGGSDYCPNPQLALDGSNIYDGKRAPGGFGTFDADGYSPPSGGKNRYLDGRDMMFAYETAFNILPGETYTVTCEARRYCGSLNLQAGLWCTDNGTPRTSTPYTWQYVGAKSLGKCSLNTAWSRYSWTVTIPDGAPFNKGQIYFQIDQDASNPSTAWVVGNIHCRRAADAQLIVDGAITASKISADAIDGRTLTGNKIVGATITSTYDNRDLALANGGIYFAYNGSLTGVLTCSSSGVYLHYVAGGVEYGITMGSGGASIVTSDGSQIAIGSGGFGVTCSDGSNMSLSKSGFNVNCGLGKLYVNGSGLRFTQDSLGYGLSMSSSGWSLKWAGSHTLATGPKAGALYIDGAEIKTSANS